MAATKTTKRTTTRKTTTKRTTKRPATRAAVAKKPNRHKNPAERFASWLGRHIARHAKAHRQTTRSRRDAAILRATHAGCTTCGGTGTLFKQDKKTGAFNGSKPCPAKPKVTKVSRTTIAITSRAGVDKRSGLIGWRCPCGKAEKPRYRDAKTATAAIRDHERKRHGGVSVGAAWFAQMPENAATQTNPAPKTAPAAKTI